MFYNTYRSTKSALQRRQNSFNPKTYLLNQPKRQKLKNLLMTKFIQKYNIKDPDEFLDLVLTQFIQNEKFNDMDLKRLDLKIKKLNKEFNSKTLLKSDLENNISQKTIQSEGNNTLNQVLNTKENITEEINNKNKQNQIRNLKNDFPVLSPYSSIVSKTESNIKNRGYSSCMDRPNKNKIKE